MDAFIAEHLKGVSRTYAILIPMLPRALAEPVGLAYLLMRIVDTIEDAPDIAGEDRERSFAALRSALDWEVDAARAGLTLAFGESAAERRLMAVIPEVLSRVNRLAPPYRDAIRTCARAMIGGVGEFAARSRERGLPYPAIRDAAELRSYCYFVAGVVGEMLCRMMSDHLGRPALLGLHALAAELGIGLQLVNILKDALKDSRQGRRYLPVCVGGGGSGADVFRAVLDQARQSLRIGVGFVLAIPRDATALRSFCGLPIAWGALTLARAERQPGRAKIGRGVVASSITRFARLASDDGALRAWLGHLLRSRALAKTT